MSAALSRDDLAALKALRRDIHAHPEIAFEEVRTAGIVAKRLAALGYEVTTGLAKTGVVGTLARGAGEPGGPSDGASIALRADLDALPMDEENGFEHRSKHPGRMHACGHDGHVAMLLGAAQLIAADPDWRGTVHLIFQPAEENEGGGRVMVAEGLFDRFPVDAVYGMHNMPGQATGTFALTPGPNMASFDTFSLTVSGAGGHAASPHKARDPLVAASAIVTALQTLISRRTDPLESGVVSVTQIHGGDTWNVIPDRAEIKGSVRAFDESVRQGLETGISEVAEGIARAHGCVASVDYEKRYPVLVNDADKAARALRAAASVVGENRVDGQMVPWMASEDFAYMLNARPGAFIFIGNGSAAGEGLGEGGCFLHNPGYDFNDDILDPGSRFWHALVRQELA